MKNRSPLRSREQTESTPLLSVSMLSYNQREYLSRAIESVLDQVTDFPCEIVIGDDCSDDGSQELLREYQGKYPHLIRLHLHPERFADKIPGRSNNMINLTSCRGKYIAMLDGDDYWTDPDKLQKQVAIMEGRPDLSLSCHESVVEMEDDLREESTPTYFSEFTPRTLEEGTYNMHDLTRHWYLPFHVSSLVMRKEMLLPFPEWFEEVLAADKAIIYHLVSQGDFHYSTRPASVRYVGEENFTSQPIYSSEEYQAHKKYDEQLFLEHYPDLWTSDYADGLKERTLFYEGKSLLKRGKYLAGAARLASAGPVFYLRALYRRGRDGVSVKK
ncbi:glycosyltransferase family 2 protein [Neolewinella antarctica]|uniref:Glycosyltransferase involved in cell wall biosynthesis n=1 Tax=Neolewinella antarctica TaxID=442734 RepID=A0ABX0XAB4_9BACT|nr:glycosyltransferase [Neolewinella antarctica]NJC26152.1 glycosyltransferase involved in cell wall biosynthesis [Neolewinella antarctica]